MGALAPVCPWIPEDDFLLKNAVEAGASLESLAKGAVQFSQRFTVHELKNRWDALLYDPVISAEASAHMIEFERAASSLPSKPNRFENSKEVKCVSGKRKAESVRNCYYSMRKRICNEPFDSMDLNFVVEPGHNNCFGNGDQPSANSIPGDPISNNFGLEDSNLDITCCCFPEFGAGNIASANVGVTVDAFYTRFHNPVEEDLRMAHNNVLERIPCNIGENGPLAMSCSGFEELGQPKVPVSNLFESIGNRENLHSEFGGSQVFNSPISDCGASLHNLGYASPLPLIPIWRTCEGVSALTIPDVQLRVNEQDMEDTFALPKDGNMDKANTSGYDVVHMDCKQKDQMPCDNSKNSTSSPNDYLAELSNTLMNFTNEEELLFMNADGKDGIEKSYIDGFSSLLLDSSNGDMPNIAATEVAVAPDNYLGTSGGEHCEELDDMGQSHYGDGYAVCNSRSQMLPCASAVNTEFPEMRNGVICCTLNTEETEIPSNDDIFLLNQMPSSSLSSPTQLKFHEANNPTSSFVKGFSDHQKANAGCLNLMKREQCHFPPRMRGSQMVPEMGLSHVVGDRGVKFELSNNDSSYLPFQVSSTACQGSSKISVANVSTTPFPSATLKDEATDIERSKHLNYNADYYVEKPAPGFDCPLSYPQGKAISIKQEVNSTTIQNQQALPAELSSGELFVNHSSTDQEQLHLENDGDIPHFSDVEAMILSMDLSPDDQDLYSSREVSRYQHEDSKRAIIRLEQAAHSCMQRLIASQGALAVLYGRHSKFYIKKSEVFLGRSTEDFDVDIDLGREEYAYKISRRQAIIKMDQSGSFYLKNLGKCSIFVNNKEIVPKQSINLTSSCLIEVKGMPFIFETNQTRVKQYADCTTKESQTQDHKV
ncbi:Microspherule protein 1 [Camellia lanceoleosa]|uniref:Microspherule protein 1 n=1 Tax=Camellia lanceoleosa TaxID=1840588 RepID=A0ACC0HSK9_9ERIC|nr:Microspherule protein 1 [Camellia lanceoleosa]